MNQTGEEVQSDRPNYYTLLGLHPSASVIDIRRAYREMSKHYHPDTTELPDQVATAKFQQLNEAYATLSNPERRLSYDLKIGYYRFGVIPSPTNFNDSIPKPHDYSKSMYLEASDRPLSSGELFILLVLGLTIIGCLILVILVAFIRGEPGFSIDL
ncbi:Heat shock protein DnaJ-like protein [Raphidiopsis brookii D9]|nr:Heat shock protein DnaJ-like protein [Raphidiopsis brookii D9]